MDRGPSSKAEAGPYHTGPPEGGRLMDFEQARTLLENGFSAPVADQMKEWHPAVLGGMIRAVDAAKQARKVSSHPDYHEPLATAHEREMRRPTRRGR